MIQRFNFYDVYGYLIPGLAVVILLWLPSTVITGHLQDEKLGLVAVAVAVAYVIGHVIQNLSANAVSAKVVKNAEGKASYPSAAMLDPNSSLAEEIKRRVQQNVSSWFGIDVSIDRQADSPIAKRRNAAFYLCRPIVNARTPYAEQYEGLYTMSRGLFIAFCLGALYMTGWVAACYKLPTTLALAFMGIKLMLLALIVLSVVRCFSWGIDNRQTLDTAILSCIGAALVGAGLIAGTSVAGLLDQNVMRICYAAVAVYFLVALRFLLLYRYFAEQFPKAVWSNFAAEPTQRPAPETGKPAHASGNVGGDNASES
jgi:hypothetical protein